jgi:hypothetical protein
LDGNRPTALGMAIHVDTRDIASIAGQVYCGDPVPPQHVPIVKVEVTPLSICKSGSDIAAPGIIIDRPKRERIDIAALPSCERHFPIGTTAELFAPKHDPTRRIQLPVDVAVPVVPIEHAGPHALPVRATPPLVPIRTYIRRDIDGGSCAAQRATVEVESTYETLAARQINRHNAISLQRATENLLSLTAAESGGDVTAHHIRVSRLQR